MTIGLQAKNGLGWRVEMPQGGKMTSTEAARQLGLRIDYVLMLVRSGRLTGAKSNGEWELDAESVEAYRRRRRARVAGIEGAKTQHAQKAGAHA
jgi:excisionase family DNA binding protein